MPLKTASPESIEPNDQTDKRVRRLARRLAFFSLGMGSLSFVRFHFFVWDMRLVGYFMKLMAGAFAPVGAVSGVIGALLGWLVKAPAAVIAGATGAALSARYIRRVSAPHDELEETFGPNWRERIPPEQAAHMLKRRWRWGQVRAGPEPRLKRDVPFWTIPGTQRALLCDIWQPHVGAAPSGLAVIYMHGGAWQSLDKDTFTRPFFRYLASHGHVVMDVAYRLCQETDMAGMVADVKRALVWMKARAARYGVSPTRVVLAGGSAGGHLALLAGYTPNHPILDPADVRGVDTSVRGVISFYGLPDLRRLGEEDDERSNPVLTALGQRLGFAESEGSFDPPELARRLFGGLPSEVPEVAALMSPITHVGPHCPPTLLLQGTHDHITRPEDVRQLNEDLCAAGAQVVFLELPQVDHAFDLFALQSSPPAQAALYDVERFLALLA